MQARRPLLFALMVLLPVVSLGWLAIELERRDRVVIEHRFQELMRAQLREIERSIGREVEALGEHLLGVTATAPRDTDGLRQMVADDPSIRQLLVVDVDGLRLHPPEAGAHSAEEAEFVARIEPLLDERMLLRSARREAEPPTTVAHHGWQERYWEQGLQLVFWRRSSDGLLIAAEIEHLQLLSRIIAGLPDTGSAVPVGAAPPAQGLRIVLAGSGGDVLYQWGRYQPPAGDSPRVQQALSPPLSSWSLRYYAPPPPLSTAASVVALTGAAVVALALVALAAAFYRQYARDMHDAEQRVSFVNHVSHELRTPLTNIRMYAQLLQSRRGTDDDHDDDAQHLSVIIDESERLSRLVDNVLTFARAQRGGIQLRRREGRAGDVVARVVERFRPSLSDRGITIRRTGSPCDAPVQLDADAMEQILGNLLSNVEKYAARGGAVEIACEQQDGTTMVRVRDAGPGISPAEAAAIFIPFHRLDDTVTGPIPGTGLGLTIARQLARVHGGDLELEPSDGGASFVLTLATPSIGQLEPTT